LLHHELGPLEIRFHAAGGISKYLRTVDFTGNGL
jgi:hypothetical protein